MRRSRTTENPAEAALRPNAPIPSEHETRFRVRYCECDPMGVAHHSAFVPWLEVGRTELLREGGIAYAQMEHAGIFLVVTRLEVNYRAPARYDDTLVLTTRVRPARASRVRIDHEYELWRDEHGGRGKSALLCTASTTLACVDEQGRVRPLPDWLACATDLSSGQCGTAGINRSP